MNIEPNAGVERELCIEALREQKESVITSYFKCTAPRTQDQEQVLMAANAVIKGERVRPELGCALYRSADLGLLALLAQYARLRSGGLRVFYNRNAHIEPTNICRFACDFCSFRRLPGQDGAWLLSLEEIERLARGFAHHGATEIHITGGVHPDWRIEHLESIVRAVRSASATVHIKAFSAIELIAIFRQSGVSVKEGLARLKSVGLCSIPGGGAEIFAPRVRERICPDKPTGEEWLDFHMQAHRMGLPSNATMLYGHVEGYEDRVDHLCRLREAQDLTGGFMAFIPLKYRAANNSLSSIGEVSTLEVLRNYAVSRIMLDNIPHLKAYWPMLGKGDAALALQFGADDLDGTIQNSTKIYSMAGAEDNQPSSSELELRSFITRAGFTPFERDSCYRIIGSSASSASGPC